MFDTERLIKEIQQRESLWNANHKDYSDKNARTQAWEEIAALLYEDFENLTEAQKDTNVDRLMRKWRNVRDYYMKDKKIYSQESLNGVKRKKKKYHFYDTLAFLDNRGHRTSKRSKKKTNTPNSEDCAEDTSYITSSNPSLEGSISLSPQYIKQEDGEAPTEDPFKEMFETRKQQDGASVTATQNFLLSLLPDVSTLNERQNMKFRLGVLNLLHDIKFGPE